MVQGVASWYGPAFYGRTTVNGERFRNGTLTAAHRTLPFVKEVRDINLSNGHCVVVRINDMGRSNTTGDRFRSWRCIPAQNDAGGGSAGEARDPRLGRLIV